MTDINSGTPERTESPEDKFTAEIPEQEEESSLLDAALGDVAVTEDQDNLLDDTGDASQIEDPVRPACTKELRCGPGLIILFEAHLARLVSRRSGSARLLLDPLLN